MRKKRPTRVTRAGVVANLEVRPGQLVQVGVLDLQFLRIRGHRPQLVHLEPMPALARAILLEEHGTRVVDVDHGRQQAQQRQQQRQRQRADDEVHDALESRDTVRGTALPLAAG